MGLDLNIKREKPVICPECGMTIGHTVGLKNLVRL